MSKEQKPVDIAIIVPVFNERDSVAGVLTELLEHTEHTIIVVDDGSTDGSSEIIDGFADRVQIRRHPFNRGYGASLKTGIKSTRARNVIFFDSDGQHDVEDLKEIVNNLSEYEFVFGERKRSSGVPLRRRPGKWILRRVCNFLALRKIPDINCGLRGGRRRIYMRMLDLLPEGFSFSTTSLLYVLRSRYSARFMPVNVRPRRGTSSVRIFYDGFKTILLSLRLMMLFDPMRAFGYPAMMLIAIGVIYEGYIIWKTGPHIVGGAIISILAGIILFHFGLLGDQIASLRKEISSHTSLFWEEHEALHDDTIESAED